MRSPECLSTSQTLRQVSMTLRRETEYVAGLGTQASALCGLQLFGFRDLLGHFLFIDALCPILVNQIASFSLVNFVLPQPIAAVLDLALLILSQETWSLSSEMGLRPSYYARQQKILPNMSLLLKLRRQAHA